MAQTYTMKLNNRIGIGVEETLRWSVIVLEVFTVKFGEGLEETKKNA